MHTYACIRMHAYTCLAFLELLTSSNAPAPRATGAADALSSFGPFRLELAQCQYDQCSRGKMCIRLLFVLCEIMVRVIPCVRACAYAHRSDQGAGGRDDDRSRGAQACAEYVRTVHVVAIALEFFFVLGLHAVPLPRACTLASRSMPCSCLSACLFLALSLFASHSLSLTHTHTQTHRYTTSHTPSFSHFMISHRR
jgi:hypothetical protein